MSEKENVETIQPAQVTPTPAAAAPAAPATPVVEAAPATPEAAKPAHDKATAAFIKQRQERKADKQRIAALEAQLAAPQSAPAATPAPAPAAPATITPVQPQVNRTEPVVVVDETAAIQETAMDKNVQSVPGAIMDIMDIVDTDPRIVRLNSIDPNLAYSEAKKVWLQRMAIAPTPPIPVAVKTSGGMSAAHEDLASLFAAVDAQKPGTKAYREAVAKVNEAMNRR